MSFAPIGGVLAKLLQVFGLLCLLAMAALAVGGMLLLPDRIKLVVQPEATSQDDRTALLRDDVATLRRDVDVLGRAIGENFDRLAQHLEDGADRRHAAVRDQLGELTALRQQLAAVEQRLPAIESALREFRAAATAAAAAPAPKTDGAVAPAAAPASPEPAASETVPVLAAAPAPAPATPPAAAAPAPPPPPAETHKFLSFTLPNREFPFARAQDYEVIASLSRVGFDAKSTLHDFSGVTSQIEGGMRANLADPNAAWTGRVACVAATLVTGVDGRDTDMRERLLVTEHPNIEFTIAGFAPAKDGVDAAHQIVQGAINGRMSIRGVTRELTMPVRLHVDESQRLVVEGQVPIRISDYSVPVPSQLGLINMQDEVAIWISLRLRPAAGSNHGR